MAIAQLSVDEDNHNLFAVRSEAISSIAKLLHSPSDEVRQFAASVLSNMSESHIGQGSIVEVGAIPALLKVLANSDFDDSYNEKDMHRECARTLANLCPRFSEEIIHEAGKDIKIRDWLCSANNVVDERLRVQACRILKAISPATPSINSFA